MNLWHRRHGGSPPRRAARRLSVILLGATMACGDEPSGPDDGPGLAPPPQLLFFSRRATESPADLFRMNDDGSAVERLDGVPTIGYFLRLAPDGRRLVFSNPNAALVGVNVDGTAVSLLTSQGDGANGYPHWSPDGTLIAFTSNRGEGRQYAPWVMRADGTETRRLSGAAVDTLSALSAVLGWTPQGQVVLEVGGEFVGGVMRRVIYLVNPDGTGLRRLFDRSGDHSPAWSPDGSKVAFISDRDGRDRLYVMNADGSGVRLLTNHAGSDQLPRAMDSPRYIWYDPWSPDGSAIAYRQSGMIETGVIYLVAADGAWRRRLTDNYSWFNGWSPDGDRIAFTGVGDSTLQQDIFVINADGTGLQNLTNDPADDEDALWIPGR